LNHREGENRREGMWTKITNWGIPSEQSGPGGQGASGGLLGRTRKGHVTPKKHEIVDEGAGNPHRIKKTARKSQERPVSHSKWSQLEPLVIKFTLNDDPKAQPNWER